MMKEDIDEKTLQKYISQALNEGVKDGIFVLLENGNYELSDRVVGPRPSDVVIGEYNDLDEEEKAFMDLLKDFVDENVAKCKKKEKKNQMAPKMKKASKTHILMTRRPEKKADQNKPKSGQDSDTNTSKNLKHRQ